MRTIEITNKKDEKFAVFVDDDDFDMVNKFQWCVMRREHHLHAASTITESGKKKTTYMHRMITKSSIGFDVDHINGNGLDNRKENLRIVKRRGNGQNRRGPASNNKHSLVRNVYWHEKAKKWRVMIRDGKLRCFGLYDTIEEAERVAIQKRNELGFLNGASK